MKLLLVDDHRLLAEALDTLITARFAPCEVRHASSLAEALLALSDDIDLILLDLGLPDAQGIEALEALRAHAPGVRLVVMSADDRAETVQAAIEQGASGFVPKQASSQRLMEALTATLQGAITLPPALLAGVETTALPSLTPRQMDVLRLLLRGQSNKLICRTLGLSESSVKTHLEAVYRRLGVNSRVQAVALAARLQLRL